MSGRAYENSKPGEAWNAAYAPDERRCCWPECQCYAPQGPQSCMRQSIALFRALTVNENG